MHTNNILKYLGSVIKEEREKKGIDIKTFSKMVKISPTTLNKIEAGEHNLRINSLHKISHSLDSNLRDFVKG